MASKKGIVLGVLAALALGSKASAKGKVIVIDDPNLPPPPDPGELPPGPIFPVEPKDPGLPGPIFPVEPKDPGAPTARQVYDNILSPVPMPDAAWKIVKNGPNYFGNNGIVRLALLKGLGREPTDAERKAYYQAITRVRTNWLLYGTDEKPGAASEVLVVGLSGDQVKGSITSSHLPMHDPWIAALNANEMPRRLVEFKRLLNPNTGQRIPAPLPNWQELIHMPPRTFGTIWLPKLDAMDVPINVQTASPEFDWPAHLWNALGIARLAWTGG